MFVRLKMVQDVATLRNHSWRDNQRELEDDYTVACAIVRGGKMPKATDEKSKGIVAIVREQMRKRELELQRERLECPWR